MEYTIQDFSQILIEEENLLDKILYKQTELKNSLKEKNWENLNTIINEINLISDYFQSVDLHRDSIQKTFSNEDIRPFYDNLLQLRIKLMKFKSENQVISSYVNVTRNFISEVIEKALPQSRNKNYTKNGMVTQTQPASVLVDVQG